MSHFSLGLAANLWIVLAIIAAAFAFAVVTYRQTRPEVGRGRRWTLIVLRTIGVGLLLLAVFEPVMSFLNLHAEDPTLFVAIDNSQSMSLGGQDSSRIAEARAIVRKLVESSLGERADAAAFSDSTRPLPVPVPIASIQATGTETRLDAAFALLSDTLRLKNVRAMVLLSDGRFNAGSNPLFEAEGLGVPVYAVGLGDSVPPRDLSLQQVFTNEIAYVGTELPVEVRLRSSGYSGGMASVTLRDDNGTIATQQVALAPGTNEYTTTFIYKPRSEGTARLRAEVTPQPGELTDRNNARSTYIRVKSNKRRYVLVAGAPGPDLAFFRRHLAADRNVTLATFVQRSGSEFLEGPLVAESLRQTEALILIGYPTATSSDATIATIAAALQRGVPLFVLMEPTTDLTRLRRLEQFLPATFGPLRGGEMQVTPELTPAGAEHPATRLTDQAAWANLPPIYLSQTPVTARPEADVLAWARVGNTRLDEPLIVARRLGRTRSMLVTGYGIYRWQLLGQGEGSPGVLGDFIAGALRWLGTIEDERRVRIATSKQLYNLGEAVRMYAQVYDEEYQPEDNATVNVTVDGPGGRRAVSLALVGTGRYEATITGLPAGDFRFAGAAIQGGREIGRDAGRFAVGEIAQEFLETAMNAELLRALAARTGGRFYTARQTGTLVDDILRGGGFKPRTVETEREYALWNTPWVLLAALLAFAAEWTLRKRSGML